MHGESFVWWLLALVVLGLVSAVVFQLTPSARLRRRRRRSHNPIISKSHHPSVKFSVRPPRE